MGISLIINLLPYQVSIAYPLELNKYNLFSEFVLHDDILYVHCEIYFITSSKYYFTYNFIIV